MTYKIVYIAGLDLENQNNHKIIEEVISKLKAKGYVKFISPQCFAQLNLSEAQFIQCCYSLIDIADIIYFYKEWRQSKNAVKEKEYAESRPKRKRCIFEGGLKCEVDGCNRPAEYHTCGNVCKLHHHRFMRNGTFENKQDKKNELAKIKQNSKCLYCDRIIGKSGRKGMCSKHYMMWRIHGDPMHFDGRVRKPNSHGYFRKGQKGEHRKVYEDYYGITLKHEQQIHHIDFNKANNSIENLWLYNTGSEHTKAHRAYEKLRKQYPTGNIKFENGVYVYKGDENEKA